MCSRESDLLQSCPKSQELWWLTARMADERRSDKGLISRAWGLLNFRRRLLVWDAYRCQIMDSVSNHARRNANSDIARWTYWTPPTSRRILEQAIQTGIQGPVQRLDGVGREVLHASRQHACSRQGFMPQVSHRSLEQCDKRGDP